MLSMNENNACHFLPNACPSDMKALSSTFYLTFSTTPTALMEECYQHFLVVAEEKVYSSPKFYFWLILEEVRKIVHFLNIGLC